MNEQSVRREILAMVMEADADTLERVHAACKPPKRTTARLGTAKQAAEILGTCSRTVFRYARTGRLTAIRQSPRRIRFDLDQATRLATEGMSE